MPSRETRGVTPITMPTPQWPGWLPLLLLPSSALLVRNVLPPWGFMWLLAFGIFISLKWFTWWRARNHVPHTAWRSVVYLLAWPGMDAESFLDAGRCVQPTSTQNWFRAFINAAFGASLLWVVARAIPNHLLLLRGWAGMLGLILLLHFGTFEIVSLCWRSFGVDARPIMSSPLQSKSLSEFWGKRWNLGFRQLGHELIFRPLHRSVGAGLAGFCVFVASGLVHDLVISVPARGGYGLPTCYFVVQGLGVAIERSTPGKQFGLRAGARGWLFMAGFTVGPAFWLFHPPFVRSVILPFMRAIHAL